ncbi:helix-turn-helix domain-containing protein [Metapseudomonas furukawaii]|uniref:helix-turn-helix domain-containing protein n=1 Tax=Metapseudomonas furukawaii TaxID=1149133 RepID=UPI00404523BD
MNPADPKEIPTDPTLRWEWIKWQLRRRYTSLAKLAKALNVERNAMNNVKRTQYPRMEREIAKALGLQPYAIWPERWSENGEPHRSRPNRAESCVISNAANRTPQRALAHRIERHRI